MQRDEYFLLYSSATVAPDGLDADIPYQAYLF